MSEEMISENIVIPYQKKKIDGCMTYQTVSGLSAQGSQTPGAGTSCVILTHGAGGDMTLSQLVILAQLLAKAGYMVLRFTCRGLNLKYRIKVYTEVLTYVYDNFPHLKKCFIGGRSMGARAAVGASISIQGTQLCDFVKGVICVSYPLHKAKDEANLGDEPLRQITKPVLFISGTKDDMCLQSLMETCLKPVNDNTVLWIEGADHGLKVKGQSESEVVEEVFTHIHTWCQDITDTSKHSEQTSKRLKTK